MDRYEPDPPFERTIRRGILNKSTYSKDWALEAFSKLKFVEPESHLVFWLEIHF